MPLNTNAAKIRPVKFQENTKAKTLGGFAKRVFDIVFAALALPVVSLVILVCVCWIKVVDRGPAFFVQMRVGNQGKLFPCLKLRTMVVDAEDRLEKHLAAHPSARLEFERDQKLKGDPRVIPGVGKLLRTTSLDELPQFINVLAGQMSVVGPRPITSPELERYGDHRAQYLQTRPGITGLWQVSGRNNLTFDERVQIDSFYVKSWSMLMDFTIIIRTIRMVMSGHGAY